MTILSRSAGIDRIGAEFPFPFFGLSPVQGVGGPHDPAGTDWMPATAWDLGPGAGGAAGLLGLVPGTALQPRRDGLPGDGTGEKAAAAPPAVSRVLIGAEAAGMGRLKQGVAADPLHGLPAHDLPPAQARQDLLDAADRDWLGEAAQADSFVFLPAPDAPGHAGKAHPPALPAAAEDWLGLLILRPEADPILDVASDVPVLADHGPLVADHVFF